MRYYVYIIYSKKLDRFYTGTTDDPVRRLAEHNAAFYADTFTVKGIPWQLYHIICCPSSEIAYKLEAFIKKMKSKAFIERLKNNPEMATDIIQKLLLQ